MSKSIHKSLSTIITYHNYNEKKSTKFLMCYTSRWLLTFGFGRTFFRARGAGSAGAHRHVGVQEFFVHGG